MRKLEAIDMDGRFYDTLTLHREDSAQAPHPIDESNNQVIGNELSSSLDSRQSNALL